MTAGPVPTGPITDLTNNTTPFTTASSSAMDAAFLAVVNAVNDNWAAYYAGIQAATLPNPDGSVTTAKLRDSSVTTAKLADLAVTAAKIAVGAVGATQLDPALLTIYADIAINAKFAAVDAQILNKSNKGSIFINVMDYGAIGDGTHDDTTAVLAAISACAAGGTVYFPVCPLRYLVTSQINIAKSIRLLGPNASDNQNGGTRSTTILFNSSTGARSFNVTASGVTIENLFIQNAGTTTMQIGLYASSLLDIKIINTWFQNYITGIWLSDCIVSKLDHVIVRDSQIAFRLDSTGAGGTSINLSNCWAMSPTVTGYYINNHFYCTLINCACDGFSGSEPNNAFSVTGSGVISFVGCASERIKNSAYLFTNSNECTVTSAFNTNGNVAVTGGMSFAQLTGTSTDISFIGCKDINPTAGSNANVTNTTANVGPVMMNCDFSLGYNNAGTIVPVLKNSIVLGLAAVLQDGVIVKASDSATIRKKITVTSAGVISAATI